MLVLTFAAFAPLVSGHGFVINPKPRQAADKDLPLFANGAFPLTNGKPGCTTSTGTCGCWCTNGTSPCEVAQSCFWFSQGCTIGCDTCVGKDGSARTFKDLCDSGMNATVCDWRLRTYNQNATCNTKDDIYRYNPWRAPGSAPMFDPCGKAGGGVNDGQVGGGAAFYIDTVNAKGGDLGSQVLKEIRTGIVWKVGQEVEASWGLRANHGGGAQFRLCPKAKNLTEECFKEMPIPFVGKQYLQYKNGSRELIQSSYCFANGTGFHTADGDISFIADLPGTWVRNPIPDGQQGDAPGTKRGDGTEFPPPCADDTSGPTHGLCSGERPFDLSIVDILKVPATTPPGEYVLGWRWDVEETAQVWVSCSDITIAA